MTRFDDQYPKYKARPSYEQNLQSWITEYEGVDNDEDIVHYFGNLSINTNDCKPEFELFYIVLEQFHISIG